MQPEEVFVQSGKERLAAADGVLASQVNGRGGREGSHEGWPKSLVGVSQPADFVPQEFPISAGRDLVRHAHPCRATRGHRGNGNNSTCRVFAEGVSVICRQIC